ncbi:MAG: hypothetical protein KDI17_05860 [Halioglobus sp.]|nr:hypothetical protein [Halioglobus sp.]
MKSITLSLFASLLLLQACSHPIEIIGEGDVLSASGDRSCLLEEHAAGADNCSNNLVVHDYRETYYAVPRPDWTFHRWVNQCSGATGNECSFDISANAVRQFWGQAAPPLTAIFRPTVNTGLNALLIGHSFFDPIAEELPGHALLAGFSDHTQSRFYSGAASGTPQALWENASKRTAIQAVLDSGQVQLFGMTYHPDYPGIEGYRNWVNYALEKNPDTRFFIALPWLTTPANFDAATYAELWHQYHPAITHAFIDTLRAENPGVDFYCIPYGQSALELRNLYSAGNLPEVDTLVSSSGDAIYRDSFGHADDILLALAELVWLRAIYGVDLSSYNYDPGYTTDLKAIAQSIMDAHDVNYNAP